MSVLVWVFAACAVAVYLTMRTLERLSYWKRKGVAQARPLPFVGHSRPWSFSASDLYLQMYREFKDEPYVGLYEVSGNKLLLRDPQIIHRILVRDFHHFADRSSFDLAVIDPLDKGLFMIGEPNWRPLRNKLSPAFTSGKLKGMFERMVECAALLGSYIEDHSRIEARELMFVLTSDVVASCAFGLDVRSKPDDSKTFRQMCMTAFKFNFRRTLGLMLLSYWPRAASCLGISFSSQGVLHYFRQVIQQTFAYRRSNDVKRDDFVQLLLQLGEKGYIEYSPTVRDSDDDYLSIKSERQSTETVKIDDNVLAAQAYVFLTAGSEPLANTMMFTAFELAKNQQLQERVRNEVNKAMADHGGLSYEAVQQMPLLEMCIQETMRMYPVTKQLFRVCTRPYRLEETGLTLEKGNKIVISLAGLHRDPDNFPDPDLYNPERFLDPPRPGTYLPFGEGPRICIGMRFAMIEMKVGLSMILHRYALKPITEAVELNRWSFLSVPTHGLYISFDKVHPDVCSLCPNV